MPKIFIDYGHGGSDPGAVSGSYKEKDFTLKIGQRIKYHLQRHQQTVVESRNSDLTLSLSERSNKANNNNVDISVSIHCNSFSDPNAQGVETYCYPGSSKGKLLADKVHKSIISSKLYTKNRKVKEENFHMLREIKSPSILIETAFISNEADRNILINNYEGLAIAITKGILSYWDMDYVNEKTETVTPGEQKYYRVQVGAFKEKKNADGLASDLRKKGYATTIKYY